MIILWISQEFSFEIIHPSFQPWALSQLDLQKANPYCIKGKASSITVHCEYFYMVSTTRFIRTWGAISLHSTNMLLFCFMCSWGDVLELSVQQGKHNTRTLSLVIHGVRSKKTLLKTTLALNEGWNSENLHFFGGKLSFTLSLVFPEHLHCGYIYFQCSYLSNYYNYSRTLWIKWSVSAFYTEI